MHKDFEFYSEEETVHDDTFRQKNKNYEKDSHVMDEVISILKSLIKIFDIVSEQIKKQK